MRQNRVRQLVWALPGIAKFQTVRPRQKSRNTPEQNSCSAGKRTTRHAPAAQRKHKTAPSAEKKTADTHPNRRLGKTEKLNTSFWGKRMSQTLRFGKRGLRTVPYSTTAAPHVQTKHPDRRSARTAYNLHQNNTGAIRNDADNLVGFNVLQPLKL